MECYKCLMISDMSMMSSDSFLTDLGKCWPLCTGMITKRSTGSLMTSWPVILMYVPFALYDFNFFRWLTIHPDFSSLQLFFIEGDYIQLREGAQKTIAATATAAKVAAAAAAGASSFSSSLMSSVAVTPMAHPNRLKKVSS